VNLNSDRLGVRLGRHRFGWARRDGGVAGDHPSNVLDGSYPVGGVIVNGDVPTILGPDGPTSGGFTVIATVVRASLWKAGQLRPGHDTVRFREVDPAGADALAGHAGFALDPRHLEQL
jgi:urea carboxylase